VLILIGMVVPLTVRAAPAEVWHYTVVTTDPPNPGSGWGSVTQLLTSSGCDGTSCGSSWRPRTAEYEVLLENSGDRVSRGHAQGDGTPPYNATVVYRRQTCPTDGAWAAGTWHHNFLARSRLEQTGYREVQDGGQTHYYITFTQRWSSRYYQSFAHNDPCFSADPFPQVTPTPPTAGGSPPPPPPAPLPGRVRIRVSVVVNGTPPTDGSASGEGAGTYTPGSMVRATASYPSAWDDDPTWGGISYSGCGQSGSDWQVTFAAPGNDCALVFTIRFSSGSPGATPPPQNPCTGGGPPIPDSSYSLWKPVGLEAGSPGEVFTSTVTLTFQQNPAGYGSGLKQWKEQSIELTGPVSGRLVWKYETGTDHGSIVRQLRNSDRRRITFARPVPGHFRLLWNGHPSQPTIQFSTVLEGLPSGVYQIVSDTRNVACTGRFNKQTFYFQVIGTTSPPSVLTAKVFGWVRSAHDGATAAFQSTQHNVDPAHFSWNYGGIAEFYPDITLNLPAGSGYQVTSSITGWHFRGSPPLDPAPVDRVLAARQPIRLLWSKYPPSEWHTPDVEAYRILRVDTPVAIAVTVAYTYQVYDAAGILIGPLLTGSVEGQFIVSLVYPQVLDGGQ
jgi:hypothetical protein